MATVDDESIARKLQSVSNAQDSIQSLSLWIIHHKNQHKRIVELWLKVLRKAKVSHRLTLFYLCNDVVQNCKRKQAVMYLGSFQSMLKAAVPYVRDPAIRAKMERIFSIWEERNVYSSEFIAELRALLTSSPKSSGETGATSSYKPSPATATTTASNGSNSTSAAAGTSSSRPPPDPKLLADFKPIQLIDKIRELQMLETEVEMKKNHLQHCKVDLSNTEAVRQLKDLSHGKEFSRQVEESSTRLEEYVQVLERLTQARKSLKQALHVSEVFYDEQFREVKIVAHAYKNFGSRVGNVRKKLGEVMQTLPDPLSPIPSPNMDAPSPGNTPPQEPDKDTETVDMELSEEDEAAAEAGGDTIISPLPGRVANTITTKSISKPIPSIREFRVEGAGGDLAAPAAAMEESSEEKPKSRHHHSHHGKRKASPEDTLEKRIADILPNLPSGSTKKEHKHRRKSKEDKGSSSSHKMKSVVAKVIYNSPKSGSTGSQQYSPEEGGGTPLADERPSTPVLDEKSPVGSSSSTSSSAQKMNPIDFLSQLISTSQKAGAPGSAGTNSSFLTQLTSVMGRGSKPEQQQQNGVEEEQQQQQSWATWKRDNQPPEVPPPPASVPLAAPPRPILPPATNMVPPPTMPPVIGVAPPSPDMLPPRAPPPNFGAPPPRTPGLPMPPRFPDFSQPPPSPFFPQTSPGQKENWPVSNPAPPAAASLAQQLQSVPVILGTSSNRPPPRSSPSDLQPRGGSLLSPQGGPTSPPIFPPPPASAKPIKGILRHTSHHHHSVLKEVPLLPLSQDPEGPGPSTSASPPGGPPKPPSLPPSPAEMRSRPHYPPDGAGPSSDSDADFLEFSEKLKRKTSSVGMGIPSQQQQQPSRPPFRNHPRNPNLMTLTPDPQPEEEEAEAEAGGEMDMDMGLDDDGSADGDGRLKDGVDGEGDEGEEEVLKSRSSAIQPIASLGSMGAQLLRGGGRNSHGGGGAKTLPSAVVPVLNQHPAPSGPPPFGQQSPLPPPRDFGDSRHRPHFHSGSSGGGRRQEEFGAYPSNPPRDPYYQGYPGGRGGPQYDPYRQGSRPPQYYPQRPQYAAREYDNRYYRR